MKLFKKLSQLNLRLYTFSLNINIILLVLWSSFSNEYSHMILARDCLLTRPLCIDFPVPKNIVVIQAIFHFRQSLLLNRKKHYLEILKCCQNKKPAGPYDSSKRGINVADKEKHIQRSGDSLGWDFICADLKFNYPTLLFI